MAAQFNKIKGNQYNSQWVKNIPKSTIFCREVTTLKVYNVINSSWRKYFLLE